MQSSWNYVISYFTETMSAFVKMLHLRILNYYFELLFWINDFSRLNPQLLVFIGQTACCKHVPQTGNDRRSQEIQRKAKAQGNSQSILLLLCQAWLFSCQGWLFLCQGWLFLCQGGLFLCQGWLFLCQGWLYLCQGRLFLWSKPV